MRKIGLLFILLVMMSVLPALPAHAVGFGFYGSTAQGSGDWEDDVTFSAVQKFSADSERRAFGFSLDTGLAGQRFFNYHLNIGREIFTSKNFIARNYSDTVRAQSDLELDGMVVSHTFGFGAALSDSVRMWMGPEIRWHSVKGSPDAASAFDVEGAGFGFGPSFGVNFNFPSGMTLMIKAGYIMSKYSLDGDGYINGTVASNSYDVDEKFTYVNFELLFRSPGDR